MASPNKPTLDYDIPVYAPAARRYHWWAAALVLLQLPLGFYMMYRAEEMPGVNDKGEAVKGVWNGIADGGLTDTLFSSHKILGLVIFALIVARLAYRLMNGAPRSDPTVPAALTGIGHAVHWSLYLLLLAVPVGGYLGISYGNYLDVFGINLPALTAENKDMSKAMLEYHGIGAALLGLLAAMHIGGALFHKVIRKDRVVERMLPKKNRVA
ncbi:MAG: cytochrome b [Hyphomicrobium sp.]|nr:cytochrome b [Hyphomicrobium sp.]